MVGAAWAEYLTTKQTATGNGELYVPQLADVPGWFPAVELGMALEHGPSINATRRTLKADNAVRRRKLRDFERANPERIVIAVARRMSPDEARAAMRAALRRGGITIRKGKHEPIAV